MLPAHANGTAGTANPLRWEGRAGWLTSNWFELGDRDLWDTCCPQSLLCLCLLLPSLQFIGQNPHQTPLRWRRWAVLGPDQAGGSPGRMTKCSPSTWSGVPIPVLPCRRSFSGRIVHSCQVRANSKRSLNFYREEDPWFTAPSPSDPDRQARVLVASANLLWVPLSYLYYVPARAVLSTQTFQQLLLQGRCPALPPEGSHGPQGPAPWQNHGRICF